MMNASTASGREPFDARSLVRAAGDGDAARVESLLAAGADANAATESGETPLIRAASKGHAATVRLLLAAGADANAEREDGFTALGVAVFFGYADVVRALLEGGADPSAKGRLGASAEKWARFSGFAEIAEMLKGASGWEEADVQFFPSEGTFSPVVPLSEFHAAPPPEEVADTAAADRPPEVEVEARAPVFERRAGVEWKEPEVATVVRPRVARAKGIRRTWPLTAAVLAVSLTAGLVAGSYLMRPRPLAEAEPSAPTSDASPAENGTQAAEPDSATATTTAPPAPPAAEPSTPAEPESSTPAETESSGVARRAQRPAPAESARAASADEPASRGEAKRAARDERRTRLADAEKSAAARRDSTPAAAAPRRPRRTEGRVLTSSPRDNSLPVFSPSPSSKSGKKKVIPWP